MNFLHRYWTSYWTESTPNCLQLNNDTIVFLELLYSIIWICLICNEVCIIDSFLLQFITVKMQIHSATEGAAYGKAQIQPFSQIALNVKQCCTALGIIHWEKRKENATETFLETVCSLHKYIYMKPRAWPFQCQNGKFQQRWWVYR